ncbi:MAG: hypothetical protein LBT90_04230 [Holosporaceae bacterium]|nr:hypothetical protein [Holosporaceae bacterium]
MFGDEGYSGTKTIRKQLDEMKSSLKSYFGDVESLVKGLRKATTEGERNKVLSNKGPETIEEGKDVVGLLGLDVFLSSMSSFSFYMQIGIDYLVKGIGKFDSSKKDAEAEGKTLIRIGCDFLGDGLNILAHNVLIGTALTLRVCKSRKGNEINNGNKLFELDKIKAKTDITSKANNYKNAIDELKGRIEDDDLKTSVTKASQACKYMYDVISIVTVLFTAISKWTASKDDDSKSVFDDVTEKAEKLSKELNAGIDIKGGKLSSDSDANTPIASIKKKKKDRGKDEEEEEEEEETKKKKKKKEETTTKTSSSKKKKDDENDKKKKYLVEDEDEDDEEDDW